MRPVAAIAVALGGCADRTPCAVPGAVCTLAGVAGLRGFNGDGLPATASWLSLPTAVLRDPAGDLLVNDYNNQRVRRLGPEGTLETVVGLGFHGYAAVGVDALDSPLDNVVDLAFDPEGRLLLAEQHGARVLRVGFDGVLEHVAGVVGEPGFSGDGGPAASAHLSELGGLAAGPDGTIYLGDTGNHCVRAVSPDGRIDAIAGVGTPAFEEALASPQHVRLDPDGGVLYVADTGNHAIRRLDLATGALDTVAGTGSAGDSGDGGPATEADLRTPYAAEPDGEGGFFVADSGNHRVRHVGADGIVRAFAGTGAPGAAGDAGPARRARFEFPTDVRLEPDGALLIVDPLDGTVRRVAP